jgi:hypothetical protein
MEVQKYEVHHHGYRLSGMKAWKTNGIASSSPGSVFFQGFPFVFT